MRYPRKPPNHRAKAEIQGLAAVSKIKEFSLAKGKRAATSPPHIPHPTMADNIQDKVRDIIVEQLGVNPEQVTLEAKFIEDLGADSLDTVELVMAFEEEFGIDVPDDEAEKLLSVGDVVRYVEENAE